MKIVQREGMDDLRGTFVTLAAADGRAEPWVKAREAAGRAIGPPQLRTGRVAPVSHSLTKSDPNGN